MVGFDLPPKVQNLTELTASRLLVYCDSGSPLLGVYDVDARELTRISTVCDDGDVAIDDVIERESWFATTANGVVCSLPKALDRPGKALCRSWQAAPAADPELLWVQHPEGADRSVAIDGGGRVRAERGAPVPAADLGHCFVEGRTAIAGVVPIVQQTFVTRSGLLNVTAAGVQQLGSDGSVLGVVVPEGLAGGWFRASARPQGDVLSVTGQLDSAGPAGRGSRWGLWLVELPGLRVQRVLDELNGWASQPVWSLDGKWIFVGGEVTPTDGLWAVKLDTRTLHLVEAGVHVPSPLAALI